MHSRLLVIAALTLLGGCVHFTSVGPTTMSASAREVSEESRQLAALAFITRAGEALVGSESSIDEILASCIKTELDRQPQVTGKYSLVWGPATFKFPRDKYDDNMIFIVGEIQDSSSLVVVVRGTNSIALIDWLKEDLAVKKQIDWPFYEGGQPVPRLSKGTHVGLSILQTLESLSGIPGQTMTARDYLRERAAEGSLARVTVVGHSLAGALAPTFALWLRETEDEWNGRNVRISVTALAGATPGDQAFATYYDQILGDETDRLFNPYDIVPLAWNTETMYSIPGLYADAKIRANWLEKLIVSAGIRSVRDLGYQQINASSSSLEGSILDSSDSFLGQAGWQHQCGYVCAMKLEMKTISRDCRVFPDEVECSCPVL